MKPKQVTEFLVFIIRSKAISDIPTGEENRKKIFLTQRRYFQGKS